jgi:hypothetical protein
VVRFDAATLLAHRGRRVGAVHSIKSGKARLEHWTSAYRPNADLDLHIDEPEPFRISSAGGPCNVFPMHRDQYDRVVARCNLDGTDLSEWLYATVRCFKTKCPSWCACQISACSAPQVGSRGVAFCGLAIPFPSQAPRAWPDYTWAQFNCRLRPFSSAKRLLVTNVTEG